MIAMKNLRIPFKIFRKDAKNSVEWIKFSAISVKQTTWP